MANIFRRQPQIGGDTNSWGTYLNAIIGDATGKYSSYLYNDSGTLKLSKGVIGIDNDTNTGLAVINTITTITLTGSTGIWQKIELSVSGASVTLAAANIAGKTNPAVLPTEFTTVYDAEKMGYYIATTKRCIGVVFVDSGGVLAGIVNAEDGILGYYGNAYLNTTQTAQIFWEKKYGTYNSYATYEIGSWDMDTFPEKNVAHYLADGSKIKNIYVLINKDDSTIHPLLSWENYGNPYISGTVYLIGSSYVSLNRANSAFYDSADYNDPNINRGNIYLRLSE